MNELRKLILIIEDDAEIRHTLTEVLADQGLRSIATPNGSEALDYLSNANEEPGLILLDLLMPVMDGYRFREFQLGDPQISCIPTVILSADGSLDQRAEELKISEFLKKPIELACLLQSVEKYC